MEERRSIRRLDASVVNRIAAGEVVQRPASALKEMLENSLDAKATAIHVTVKDGGIKYLQIQDNGIGIAKEDLNIICERHTTSKIEHFDDIRSLQTYGFRGEALASISHVAHVTITTKTAMGKCGYKVSYVDGKWKSPPIPCGFNQGTQITVENFFYNVVARQKMLKNTNEEYQKIYDVLSRYAIHNSSVGFTLKKYGQDDTCLKTLPNSTIVDNISCVFGPTVTRDMMEVNGCDETLKFKFHGYVADLNYHSNKFHFLLFINHRLVKAEALKKELGHLYSIYLPVGALPFIYLSLEMAPQNVDVNVHPTKHSVFYLYEEAVNKKIKAEIQRMILGKQACRTYQTHVISLLSQTNPLAEKKPKCNDKSQIYPHEKVRTNSSDQKIDRFFEQLAAKSHDNLDVDVSKNCIEESAEDGSGSFQEHAIGRAPNNASIMAGDGTDGNCDSLFVEMENFESESLSIKEKKVVDSTTVEGNKYAQVGSKQCTVPADVVTQSQRREFHLTSLELLRQEVVSSCDTQLKDILRDSVFVGCVDSRNILFQQSTELYFCNILNLCQEFFYQLMLSEFGNFGVIKFSKPLSIVSLLKIAYDIEENCNLQQQSEMHNLCQNLLKKAEMLEDYFSIACDEEGNITSIPYLLPQFSPDPVNLPEYVKRLATEVNWDDEKVCIHGICHETACFYSRPPASEDKTANLRDWKWTLEHILYPAVKRYVFPSKDFLKSGTLCLVTNVRELYTIFERC